MLTKYVEGRFPTYFVLGGAADGNRVNVCSLHRDDVMLATPEEAAMLIEDRDKIVSYLASMADAFDKAAPEHFSHFWYGSEKPKEDYKQQRDECVAALKAVVRVADRATVEFDAARAAIARCEGGMGT